MPRPLTPGVFTELFARLSVEAEARAAVALTAVAKLVQDRAVQSVAARTHPHRTKTPANRGGPPASVSGTLARSLTYTPPIGGPQGWEIKVGTAAGVTPPYSSRTPSSKYGMYLETSGAGRSHVRYPFLAGAFHATALEGAYVTFKATFASGWGIG